MICTTISFGITVNQINRKNYVAHTLAGSLDIAGLLIMECLCHNQFGPLASRSENFPFPP